MRSFVRNAQVSTMVLLAVALAGQGVTVTEGGTRFVFSGPGLIGAFLIVQLIVVARRLLREGYAFDDIRAALLAEAQVQHEEAEAIQQRRWLRRLDTLWHRLWAGKLGRWFFRVAGCGLKAPARLALPSVDATEVVLERSALAAYAALPDPLRHQARDLPAVVQRLEGEAEALRARGETGERLTETVAALENLRLGLLRLQAGVGSVEDLTLLLQRAQAIGEHIDRRLEAEGEVRGLFTKP